jgi:phosphoribosylanthranilate isomerase
VRPEQRGGLDVVGARLAPAEFRIRDAASLEQLPRYPTDAWLLDTYAADKIGGTGETFNWAAVPRGLQSLCLST